MPQRCRHCDKAIDGKPVQLHFSVAIPLKGDYERVVTVPASYSLCAACHTQFSRAKHFDKYRMMQAMIAKG
ncbi:MAG: hypothetical protein HYY96_04980 [Candidatus Tectomicrobia bacterium]|nr:hypothetical protein [Candidatus Tectomicrobia bacterium]